MKKTTLLRPPRLSAGSRVALVAPGFACLPERVEQGRRKFEERYQVTTVMLDSITERESYFAGTDARRADELFQWLTDPTIDAVMAARGGYGTARVYPELIARLRKVKNLKPKIVAGYSDVTILLNGLHQDLGWATFHSPVVTDKMFRSSEPDPLDERTFEAALFSGTPVGTVAHAGMRTLVAGRARAPIVGGCLSLLQSSLGTPYEIDTSGKILFIEDVDERPYRLDRMAVQLMHAGKLDGIAGLIIGQLPYCDPPPPDREPSQTTAIAALRSALEPFLRSRGIPTIFDFPAGHGSPQITFAIGAEVEIRAEANNPEVELLESGVS